MSKTVRLFEMPVLSTEFINDATFHQAGKVAVIHFDYYRDSKAKRSGIRFLGVVAIRTRGERLCTSWHIRPYDKLVEVLSSEWAQQIREEMPDQYRASINPRHMMIYLDSTGCFEVLANEFEILPEEDGQWEA